MTDEDYYTVREVSEILGLDPKTTGYLLRRLNIGSDKGTHKAIPASAVELVRRRLDTPIGASFPMPDLTPAGG